MDFDLPKEHEMLQKAVREFTKKKVAPNVDEWDANHYLPYKEAIRPMGELGFFGTVIPEAYGGEEMDWLAAMIVTEEIARVSSSLRVQVNMQVLGCAYTIFRYGTEDIKQKYIPKLCSAEYMGGFGITEPDAGSDVMAMTSTAEDKGDHWLLNGSKTWISNANVADVLIYYAYTDKSPGLERAFRLRDRAEKPRRDQNVHPGKNGLPLVAHRRDVSGQRQGAQGKHPGQSRRRGQDRVFARSTRPGCRRRPAAWGWPRPAWTPPSSTATSASSSANPSGSSR